MKRVFYANINYGCNSKCVFCFSHNTTHASRSEKEIDLNQFTKYLRQNDVCKNDRVVINGGEPLLYSNINRLLSALRKFDCEVIIYTNGRLLDRLELSELTSQFRFVIPVHGWEDLHDRVTQTQGSYRETVEGLNLFRSECSCLSDIKIIINPWMLENENSTKRLFESLNSCYCNHAIHITQMATTKKSKVNCVPELNREETAGILLRLFNYYLNSGKSIKIYDSCVKRLNVLNETPIIPFSDSVCAYFYDYAHEWRLPLNSPHPCHDNCNFRDYCLYSINTFLCLEYRNGISRVNLE